MRLLTARGICEEVTEKEYQSNAAAELLDSPEQQGATKNMFVDKDFFLFNMAMIEIQASDALTIIKD